VPEIVLRGLKGTALTHAEVDANFARLHRTAQAIIMGAVGSMNNNARTKGAMPNPPTITVGGTGSAPAGYEPDAYTSYVFGATGAPFVYGGGEPVTVSGATTFPCVRTSGSTRDGIHWQVEFVLDGDGVALLLDSVTSAGYRFKVDGQYVSMVGTTSAAGGARWYTLEFTSRKRRLITVEGQSGMAFRRAAVKVGDAIITPSRTQLPPIYVVGDSNLMSSGNAYKGDGKAVVIADHLGILDVRAGGAFGTGFIATDGGTKNTYAARRADWTALPEVGMLIFWLSVNDYQLSPTTATFKAAVALEIAQARAALGPYVPILIFGEELNPAESLAEIGALTTVQAYETAVQEAVTEANDSFLRFVPTINSGGPGPVHGTSTSNNFATYNNGSNHFNADGYGLIGRWWAAKIVEALSAMFGIVVPQFSPAPPPVTITLSSDGWSERRLVSDEARTNDTSVQNWFASAGSVPLLANSTYEFEGELFMLNGATSHGLNLLFAALAGATIQWEAIGAKVNQTTQAIALRMAMSNTFNTARNVTTASTVTGNVVKVRGVIETTTAGNFTPQFSQSAASGSVTVLAGTFMKIRRVGSNAFVNSGDWA
jgi:lysophospholipase L1-like esterase